MRKKSFLTVVAVTIIVGIAILKVSQGELRIFECPHRVWIDGKCRDCGKICEHNFGEGVCTVCGYVCPHDSFIRGRCSVCGYDCTHPGYTDGRCMICGIRCTHTEFTGGVCDVCGKKCYHEKFVDGKCSNCGYICLHDSLWDRGRCMKCGTLCSHPEYMDGICTVCGMECGHPSWNDSRCMQCGMICEHNEWADGACTVCGIACEHDHFNRGTCTICGMPCSHPVHNASGQCLVCGRFVTHQYADSVCTVCGKPIQFVHDRLPVSAFSDVPEKGTTEFVTYPSIQYETGNAITKRMHVYLPYGYDPGKKYDLLLLMPGLGDTEEKYFADTHEYLDGTTRHLQDMFDYAIYTGVCEPMIAVSLSWCDDLYPTEAAQIKDCRQVGQELRNVILPYLAEHYSLYAENGSDEELIKNRAHVAYYGLSYGALMVHQAAIPWNLDRIGSFAVCSTASSNISWAAEAIHSNPDLPIYLYMCGYSCDEISKPTTHDAYALLQEEFPEVFRDGENSFEIEFGELGHTTDLFDAMLYNMLQMVFRW